MVIHSCKLDAIIEIVIPTSENVGKYAGILGDLSPGSVDKTEAEFIDRLYFTHMRIKKVNTRKDVHKYDENQCFTYCRLCTFHGCDYLCEVSQGVKYQFPKLYISWFHTL